jgi:D-glycero-D-manno-heptose 1,7-bisphosphate phosphatase
MTKEDVESIHATMLQEISVAGGHIEKIYYCPHHWDDGCRCRKPDIGMFLQASRDYHIDVSKTIFIGDDDRDGIAADNVGCGFLQVTDQTSLWDVIQDIIG